VLSTNAGGTLVMGNCPTTYRGALIGSSDRECKTDPDGRWRGLDQSQLDLELRRAAFDNMRDYVDRLPLTVAARYGRILGVFPPRRRPSSRRRGWAVPPGRSGLGSPRSGWSRPLPSMAGWCCGGREPSSGPYWLRC
jgi:hypothetical protein